MDCAMKKEEVVIKEEKYDADEGSSYSGCTHYPILEEIKYENEQKPTILPECMSAVSEDPEYPEYSIETDCKESSMPKSGTIQESIPKVEFQKETLSADDEDVQR